ncbi:MAG: hypothetical protein IPM45_03320 [Acidimicrobiales bacterium]|nr:hypothetical protein [Acidimicrobiales bacterium]
MRERSQVGAPGRCAGARRHVDGGTVSSAGLDLPGGEAPGAVLVSPAVARSARCPARARLEAAG